MSPLMIIAFMFLSMFALLMTGRHFFIVVGAVATISALLLWGTGGELMPFTGVFSFMKWYPLIALPPFIFMGLMLSKSGIADHLYTAIYYLSGRIKGGLAMGTIGLCALISAMSGANVAATVTAGTIALPQMLKRKYDKLMVTGVVQAGGAMGFLIPPSLVFIIYGMIAKASVGQLWLSGVIPGLLLTGMFIFYIAVRCHRNPQLGPPVPAAELPNLKGKLVALRYGIAPVALIFAVLGLLFMGVTSLIECSAIGAVGSIVCAAIYRKLDRKLIADVCNESLKITAMFLWIIAASFMFGAVFDGLGAAHAVGDVLGWFGGGKLATLIIMQASFFGLGCFLDDTALLIIVAPLYIPLVRELGIDIVWFGLLYVVNMQMAMLTPPFGYNLFLMKGIIPIAAPDSGITMADIYRSVLPFVGIQAACLVLCIAFPQLALWLPNLVFGGR